MVLSFDGKRKRNIQTNYKKKEIYEANVMLYEIRIRQFNDEYLCV